MGPMTSRRLTPAGKRDCPDECEWAGCTEPTAWRVTFEEPKDILYYCEDHGGAARHDDKAVRVASV